MNEIPPLWKHQLEAFEKGKNLKSFALFMDPGTGKSRTTIELLKYRFNSNHRILKTIIFCPPVVIQNWRDEWVKYTKIKPEKVQMLKGSQEERLKIFRTYKEAGTVFITNYEALLMKELYTEFTAWGVDILVCDESHKIKSHSSLRSKALDKLANPKTIRPLVYLLTGTPVLNSIMDLFMQYKIMDGGKTFGDNFYIFRKRYFRDINAGMPRHKYFPNWQLNKGSVDLVSKMLEPTSFKAKKSECLDLPPFIQQTLHVGMTLQQARVYREMKEDFVSYMGSDAVTASLAITKGLRLMQIVSGYAKTEEGKEIAFAETPKLKVLSELLEELTPNHKVIVWATWRNNYEEIRKMCEEKSIKVVELHGEISRKERERTIDKFNNDPSYRVLLGNPGSGGIGVNLIAASYSIFYSRNFSLEQSIQAEARNYRGGSEVHEKITRIDLVCENTIDALIEKRLAMKQEISDNVLKEISREIREMN